MVSSRRQQRKRKLWRSRAASSDRLGGSTSSVAAGEARRHLVLFGFLLLLLFVIYNLNLRTISTDDTFPNRFLPFNLLLDHNPYLDRWIKPLLAQTLGAHGAYFAAPSHGRLISAYPITTPVFVAPLYVLPAWWLSRHTPPLYPSSPSFYVAVNTMEKLSASLIAALSGAVLFLALRKVASRRVSLGVALIYGLASNTWTISSQALWRHGLTELSFAFLLWALFRSPDARDSAFWAGLALAVASANVPFEAILIFPFLLYFGRGPWKNLVLFLAPLVVLGSLVLAYNLYFFAHPLGGYAGRNLGEAGGAHYSWLARLAIGLPGSLISPSRGLLCYMPWTAFSFWGAARLWKKNNPGWSRGLMVALAALFLIPVVASDWWAGWCFGPRYATDLLPFLAWFLVPAWARIGARRVLRWAFGATVALALWVQVVGAFYYPVGNWDGLPVDVDVAPERIWDWSDTQVLRSWRAGPAPPLLLNQWKTLLKSHPGAPHP